MAHFQGARGFPATKAATLGILLLDGASILRGSAGSAHPREAAGVTTGPAPRSPEPKSRLPKSKAGVATSRR